MLISVSKKFVFIASSKNASTSIESILKPYAEIINLAPPGLKHLTWMDTLKMYHHIFNQTHPDDFFKFGVIRDPVDWVLSWFNYRSRQELKNPGHPHADTYLGDKSFEEFWQSEDWVKNTNQRRFFIDEKGEKGIDYLIYFKNLAQDFDNVAAKLGISEKISVVRLNKSDNIRITRNELDENLLQKIKEHYIKDYEFIEKYCNLTNVR